MKLIDARGLPEETEYVMFTRQNGHTMVDVDKTQKHVVIGDGSDLVLYVPRKDVDEFIKIFENVKCPITDHIEVYEK